MVAQKEAFLLIFFNLRAKKPFDTFKVSNSPYIYTLKPYFIMVKEAKLTKTLSLIYHLLTKQKN